MPAAEYAIMNYETLGVVAVHVLHTYAEFGHFTAERTAKNGKEMYQEL